MGASKRGSGRTDATRVYVALLRAVNVGGKNRLPMADLATIATAAGCADVRTYIQSGNVVFTATAACAARVPELVSTQIEKRFGFRPAVILRTADELASAAKRNPFLHEKADVASLYVGFLADEPDPDRVAVLDSLRSPGDSFKVIGREVYLRLAKGAGTTKLTNDYFESKLATKGTVRNWRTVQKLVEMVRAGRA